MFLLKNYIYFWMIIIVILFAEEIWIFITSQKLLTKHKQRCDLQEKISIGTSNESLIYRKNIFTRFHYNLAIMKILRLIMILIILK